MKRKFNMREWLRDRTADVAVDDNLLQQSRAARIGKALIQASVIVHILMPVLTVAGVILAMSFPALAQTPGGSIFGGNDQTIGNGVREAIKWGRNLLFLLGVFGVMWAVLNYMMEKNWS